jgi:hypothetical protein
LHADRYIASIARARAHSEFERLFGAKRVWEQERWQHSQRQQTDGSIESADGAHGGTFFWWARSAGRRRSWMALDHFNPQSACETKIIMIDRALNWQRKRFRGESIRKVSV